MLLTLKLVLNLSFLCCISYISLGVLGVDYDYDKPEEWPKLIKECGGMRQSPINLKTRCAKKFTSPKFVFNGMFATPSRFTLSQNGYQVELRPTYEDEAYLTYSGGPLMGEYKYYLAVIHWGPVNGIGSEHAVNGKTGSMGISYFGYKKDYGSPEMSEDKPDGFLGFETIIQIEDESKFNPGLKAVLPGLDELIKTPNATIDLDPFPMTHFMTVEDEANNSIEFLGYNGSMLHPPCTENVQWFVQSRPIYTTQEFVDKLRKIRKSSFRPLQERHGRRVYRITAL